MKPLFIAMLFSFAPLSAVSCSNEKINLNQANAVALAHSFKGIGPKRAEAIVHYRDIHGPFRSVQELGLIKGIGKKFVNRQWTQLLAVYCIE